MIVKILLGLLLNFILGLVSRVILVIALVGSFLFLLFSDFNVGNAESVAFFTTVVLIAFIPFLGLNVWFSILIRQEMKNLYYDRILMILVLVLYWIGAALLFYLPVLLAITNYI